MQLPSQQSKRNTGSYWVLVFYTRNSEKLWHQLKHSLLQWKTERERAEKEREKSFVIFTQFTHKLAQYLFIPRSHKTIAQRYKAYWRHPFLMQISNIHSSCSSVSGFLYLFISHPSLCPRLALALKLSPMQLMSTSESHPSATFFISNSDI